MMRQAVLVATVIVVMFVSTAVAGSPPVRRDECSPPSLAGVYAGILVLSGFPGDPCWEIDREVFVVLERGETPARFTGSLYMSGASRRELRVEVLPGVVTLRLEEEFGCDPLEYWLALRESASETSLVGFGDGRCYDHFSSARLGLWPQP